ncbi:hypothetical protein [Solemya velesiana gill symbiont]|uniref:hypothetical protein n=1 Tax=Solemya velesiana gill symbiont TaxID=1918948 RepID=UPI0015604DD0|nr:hypothetical protein [Solemya velesiana gill symbiont]
MAEINQPSTIRPVWPSRPEAGVRRRKRRSQDEEKKKEEQNREREHDSDDDKPHIDEYA